MSEQNQAQAPRNPFWVFQLVGWSLLLIAILALNLYRGNTHWTMYALAIAFAGGGFGSTTLFRFYLRRRPLEEDRLSGLVLPLLLGSLVTSLVWTFPVMGLQYLLLPWSPGVDSQMTWTEVWLHLLNNYFIIVLWSLLYFAWHYFKMAQLARVDKYRSEAAARDAQLNTLKGQINPHFMFNSLNNIRTLMLLDVTKARDAITKLADILRYSMTMSEQREVSLEEELTVVRDFLALCEIQYEKKIRYSIDIDDRVLQAPIPPMMVQILVENSVKHGIASSTGGGEVGIAAGKTEEGGLWLEVTNSGKWSVPERRRESTGIGLPNIRRRLKIIHGDKATMHLREEHNKVIARIEIPL